MLKISLIDSPRQRRLVVEGKLIAPWAAELRNACQEASADLRDRELVIEMKHVTTRDQIPMQRSVYQARVETADTSRE
jgi:hypothetical protein